ncbi:MAG TPA: VOC family protein [Candidatus Lustribacter sp.]|jgi:2,3-dihydroxy-p-cumate/2,3-dihydroxybenzoate 3,4-dioxygenase|nr:VOC family protein [Candidatus Lustribacter sp.]
MPDLRYKKIGYVALNVTDRARSTSFQHETIGLETNPNVDPATFGATLLRSGSSACEVALYDAPEPGLLRVSFEMESEGYLEAAHEHLRSLGVRTWDVPASDRTAFEQRAAFRFAEPNTSLTVELYAGADAHPAAEHRHPIIDRLGHVVITVVDPVPITSFFLNEMNFRASDYIDTVAFLRCFPNPLHHSFAITNGNDNRLNHVNFLVRSLDEYGQAYNRVKRQKIDIVFGPGRHPPSGSVFLYFLDPDALTFEFSTGMEEFPEHNPREPIRFPRKPESFDYWGGARDPRHGQVGRFVREKTPA